MKEGDGNLANNYPPYDKVTRGDVIAGRLGKDQMGGKKKVNEKKDCYEEDQIDEWMTPKDVQGKASSLVSKAKGFAHLGSKGMKKADRIASKLSDRGDNWDFRKNDFSEKGKEQVKNRLKKVKGAADYALREDEQIDEVSKGAAISAYREKEAQERDTSKLHGLIKKKFGAKTAHHAERAGAQSSVGLVRRGEDRGKEDSIARDRRHPTDRITKSGKVHKQDTATLKGNIKRRLGSHTKPGQLPEETLEELKKTTLRSYRKQAQHDLGDIKSFKKHPENYPAATSDDIKSAGRREKTREAGLRMVAKKLKK